MSPFIISILIFLLLVASWQDYKNYRIGNILVISGTALGLLLNAYLPTGSGFLAAISGCAVGLFLLLPVYLLRLMGAGDVKLMAMVGAFAGVQAVIIIFFYVMIAGGVLSIAVAWHRGILKKLLCNMRIFLHEFVIRLFTPKSKQSPPTFSLSGRTQESTAKLPYGVAIAVGTVIFLTTNSNY